jgi:hypothetical membrane protein
MDNTKARSTWFGSLTWKAGLLGVALATLGILTSALAYTGRQGEPYSMANHFVSELGEVGVSEASVAFNGGIFLAGLAFLVFMVGLAAHFGGWFRFLFGIAGVITAVSGALVGVFPMNNLGPHIVVAMTFFNAGMGTMALVSVYALVSRKSPFPRWFALPGVVVTVIFALFLYLPQPQESSGDLAEATIRLLENRPDVWLVAILEWAVIGSVVAWVGLASLYLRANRRATRT